MKVPATFQKEQHYNVSNLKVKTKHGGPFHMGLVKRLPSYLENHLDKSSEVILSGKRGLREKESNCVSKADELKIHSFCQLFYILASFSLMQY